MEGKPTKIRVGDTVYRIRQIPRRLLFSDGSLSMRKVLNRKGGLIIGEGDTGKSTYAQMLFEAAKACGESAPILVRLRTRPKLTVPDTPRGTVQTIIWDGLDEYPECAREILDLTEDLDPDRYHVWVTSRPGNAASVIAASPILEDIYHLEPFGENDIRDIAESVQLDADAFLDAVRDQSLSSFMQKPGGVIILMQLFASGRLKNLSRTDLMETLMTDFARETRDGDDEPDPRMTFTSNQIIEAAGWMAACLLMTGEDAIWTGAKSARSAHDISIEDIPIRDYSPAIFKAALALRLFEPLESMRYRFAYSDMPAFLAGRWLAKHFPVSNRARLKSLVSYDSERLIDAIAWASVYDTAFGKPFILKHPDMFLGAHALIAETGFLKYLKALLKTEGELIGEKISLLNGFDAFFDFLNRILDSGKCSKKIAHAIQIMLRGDDIQAILPHRSPCWDNPRPVTIPTEREVVQMLTRRVSMAEMRELFRAEEARGLPYAALQPFFDMVVFKIQTDREPLMNPKLVGCALAYNSERYLATVVKRLPPVPVDLLHMTPEEVAQRFKNYEEFETFESQKYGRHLDESDFERQEELEVEAEITPRSVCRALETADNMRRGFLITEALDLQTLKRMLYALREFGAPKHGNMRGDILATINLLEAEKHSYYDDEEDVNDDECDNDGHITLAQLDTLCQAEHQSTVTRNDVVEIVEAATESILADNAKTSKKLKAKVKATRSELTQADVARDMGVSRKTVNEWETRQTEDGPDNKSNRFGYYKSLRTNPTLRPVYDEMVQIVCLYKKTAAEQKAKGKRTITFERFNELYHKHNQ